MGHELNGCRVCDRRGKREGELNGREIRKKRKPEVNGETLTCTIV